MAAKKDPAAEAAAAMNRRAKGNKKQMKEFKTLGEHRWLATEDPGAIALHFTDANDEKYIVYGLGVFATIAAVWLAATDGKKKSRDNNYRAKVTASVNDRYFVSDVTSYSAGNFTAEPWHEAVAPFFNGWTYADVSYGLDGVAVRGEGMIGFAGALQRCPLLRCQEEGEGLESGAVPPAYDLRVQKPGCEAGEVYDQQNCSSSYAIAAATALSARFCFSDPETYAGQLGTRPCPWRGTVHSLGSTHLLDASSSDPPQRTRLAPQQVLSCDKKSPSLTMPWTYQGQPCGCACGFGS
eukprot:Skav200725  [mRNA]  locus=scaffold1362:80849:85056:+ [translate_table: standard]